MIDLTSFVREKIFRRKPLNSEIIAGEELTEKKTTKMGYFLLVLMFLTILWSAQWSLNIISDVVERPQNVPYCTSNIINTFEHKNYRHYYSDSCKLVSKNNPEFNLTDEFNAIIPAYNKIIPYREKIHSLENDIRSIDYNYERNREDYNTALLENISNNKNNIYKKDEIANTITDDRKKILKYQGNINQYEGMITQIKREYEKEFNKFKIAVKKAEEDYRSAYIIYKFKIALLSFIFIITIFTILYKIYVNKKRKNSPSTIIFSIATFAYGLIFLQIAISLIWDLIPHTMIDKIIALLNNFTPLLYIVQFLWPVLIIAIFGYMVFRIQKRLYSPENVLKRFIKDKKCPNCGNDVDYTKPFCPLCACEIQTKCKECGELNVKGMKYCSNCGKENDKKD